MSHVQNSKYLLSVRTNISRSITSKQMRGSIWTIERGLSQRNSSSNHYSQQSDGNTNASSNNMKSSRNFAWKQDWEGRFSPLTRRRASLPHLKHPLLSSVVERSLSYMTTSPDDVDVIKSYIDDLMEKKTSPLSLSIMYKYSCSRSFSRLANAQHLHREIPIRIAHRLSELQTLPYGLAETESIKKIIDTYIVYLRNMYYCEIPKTSRQEQKFTEMLRTMVLDRHSIPNALYFGLASLKDQRREGLSDIQMQILEQDISRFMMARVGLRFLTEHHVLSSPDRHLSKEFRKQQAYLRQSDDEDNDEFFNGAISNRCDPIEEVRRVVNQVREDCISSMGMAPEIQVIDCCDNDANSGNFTYVPTHFHYMIAELLINSCRALVTHHRDELKNEQPKMEMGSLDHSMQKLNGSSNSSVSELESILPPIQVIITIGAEDCSIKIADRGGGVPRSACNNIWTFAHSTMESLTKSESSRNTHDYDNDNGEDSKEFDKNVFTNTLGRSFGLPMAKIYAQYFGGDLTIKSMEGFGVDAYLHLPILGVQCENLPESVYNSPGNLDSTIALARRFETVPIEKLHSITQDV